jgi:hypothetical protein
MKVKLLCSKENHRTRAMLLEFVENRGGRFLKRIAWKDYYQVVVDTFQNSVMIDTSVSGFYVLKTIHEW